MRPSRQPVETSSDDSPEEDYDDDKDTDHESADDSEDSHCEFMKECRYYYHY